MTARVEKLIRPAQKLSEWEKEKYVHDFICENIRYDKLKKSYSHEIIGPLGQGVGVCEGIAKAVKVLLDALGVWCVIAICGNNPETSEIRYDYFNLDDSQIFRDHEPLIAPAPHCGDHEHFYYKEKKLSFTKKEDVYKRSLQAAKKGRVLIFHWRGGYLTKEVLKELLELIRKARRPPFPSTRSARLRSRRNTARPTRSWTTPVSTTWHSPATTSAASA